MYQTNLCEKLQDTLIIRPKFRNKCHNRPPQGKSWWKDENNNNIAAGGILILDEVNNEKGIWVITEKCKKSCSGYSDFEYTDIGGRYSQDDGDIYATISREFREETYNTDEIPRRDIEQLMNSDHSSEKFVYRMSTGKYLCLVVSRKYLPKLYLNNEMVKKNKADILIHNPYVLPSNYRTIDLVFLPFSKIKIGKTSLSFRLKDILTKSRLKNYIKN